MICPNCGLETPNDANFCARCGKPVSEQGRITASGNAGTGTVIGGGAPEAATSRGENPSNYVLSSPRDETPERILWDEYPSMRTAIPSIVIAILIGGAIILALQYYPIIENRTIEIIITLVVLLVILAEILRHYIRLHSIKYRLSTQRIFVTHGLINKRTDEVELEKYKDIFVNQDFWDNIVGCGDIEVVTSDVTNPTIRIIDVTDPIGKKESLRAAARERKSILGITRREEL